MCCVRLLLVTFEKAGGAKRAFKYVLPKEMRGIALKYYELFAVDDLVARLNPIGSR